MPSDTQPPPAAETTALDAPIVWKGTDGTDDLSDDCWCEWNGLVGRAECMGSYFVTGDGPKWEAEYWWGSVSEGPEEVWSTNDNGGLIGGSEDVASDCIRGIVEQAMRAYAARRFLAVERAHSADLHRQLCEARGEVERANKHLATRERQLQLSIRRAREGRDTRICEITDMGTGAFFDFARHHDDHPPIKEIDLIPLDDSGKPDLAGWQGRGMDDRGGM